MPESEDMEDMERGQQRDRIKSDDERRLVLDVAGWAASQVVTGVGSEKWRERKRERDLDGELRAT